MVASKVCTLNVSTLNKKIALSSYEREREEKTTKYAQQKMPLTMTMKARRRRIRDDAFFFEASLKQRRKRRTMKIARNSPFSFFARLAFSFFLCAGGGSFLQTSVEAVVEVETGVTSDGIFGWSASVGVLFDDFMCDVINPLLAPNERFSECGGTFAVNPNGIGYAEEGQFVPGTRTVETERRAESTKSGFVFEEVSLIEGEQVSTPVYTANNADDDSNTNDNDEVPPPAGGADVDPQSSDEKERAEEEEEKARIEAELKAKAEAELKAELKAEAKAKAEAEAARVKAKEEEERFDDDDDDQSYSSDQTFEEEEAPARGEKEQDEPEEKEDKVSSNENDGEPLEIIWQTL